MKGFGRCIGSSFYSPGPLLALELQNWNGRGTRPSLDPDYFPKDAHQCSRVSSLFAERGIIFVLLIPPDIARKREFFHCRYSDPIEADWKMDRRLKACRYLDKHIESFEAASLAIASKKQATISKPVGIALFRFFGHATDEQVLNEPPPISWSQHQGNT